MADATSPDRPDSTDLDWQALVERGDDLFNRGGLASSAEIYRDVWLRLDWAANAAHGRLARAVVAHRLAVVAALSGDLPAADYLFGMVGCETDSATELARLQPTARYAGALLAESQSVRSQLLGVSLKSAPRLEFTAVCAHGCPSIRLDCGYQGPHCE